MSLLLLLFLYGHRRGPSRSLPYLKGVVVWRLRGGGGGGSALPLALSGSLITLRDVLRARHASRAAARREPLLCSRGWICPLNGGASKRSYDTDG